MTVLHILQTTRLPPTNTTHDGDTVLLIGDAVVFACSEKINELRERIGVATPIAVLDDDLQLRGLHIRQEQNCSTINYKEFVDLTLQHHLIRSC